MPKQIPCLWFDGQAEEAAQHYTSIFPNSTIGDITRYGPDMPPPMKEGDVLTVDFTLDGQPYTALNGGPQFQFNESISFQIVCKDQEESDRFYDRLLEGGEESHVRLAQGQVRRLLAGLPGGADPADHRPRPRPGAACHPGDAADAPHRHGRDQARRRQRARLSRSAAGGPVWRR